MRDAHFDWREHGNRGQSPFGAGGGARSTRGKHHIIPTITSRTLLHAHIFTLYAVNNTHNVLQSAYIVYFAMAQDGLFLEHI